ncbi:unnamed protein product, partial [Owenia fusiformis]
VMVEYDNQEWSDRKWQKACDVWQVFLVERTLVFAPRVDPMKKARHTRIHWPCLNFKTIIDKPGIANHRLKPVEYLQDQQIGYVEDNDMLSYKEDLINQSAAKEYPDVRQAIKSWIDYQDGQSIISTTPTVLIGYRVSVYCTEGIRQWYSAVIQAYNETSGELTVTDDTVLEEHNEDPCMIQMKIIDHSVVDSILRGIEIGIAPRRRSCNVKKKPAISQVVTNSRTRSNSPVTKAPVTKTTVPSTRSSTTKVSSSPLVKPKPTKKATVDAQDTTKKGLVEKTVTTKAANERQDTCSRKRTTEEQITEEPVVKKPTSITTPTKRNTRPQSAERCQSTGLNHSQQVDSNRSLIVKVTREQIPKVPKVTKTKDIKSRTPRKVKLKSQVGQDSGKCITSVKPQDIQLKVASVKPQQKVIPQPHSDNIALNLAPKVAKVRPVAKVKPNPEVKPEINLNEINQLPTSSDILDEKLLEKTSKKVKPKAEKFGDNKHKTKVKKKEVQNERNKNSEVAPAKDLESTPSKSNQSGPTQSAESLQNTDPKNGSDLSEFSEENIDNSMHYKKVHLLAAGESYNKENKDKDSNGVDKNNISAKIDVNISVIDQLAKHNKTNNSNNATKLPDDTSHNASDDKNRTIETNGSQPGPSNGNYPHHLHSPIVTHSPHHRDTERPHSSERSQPNTKISTDTRTDSKHTDIRMTELRRSADSDRPPTSPLVIDRSKPIEVYRDPKLIEKDIELQHRKFTGSIPPQGSHVAVTYGRHGGTHTPVPTTAAGGYMPSMATSHSQALALAQAAHQRNLALHYPQAYMLPQHLAVVAGADPRSLGSIAQQSNANSIYQSQLLHNPHLLSLVPGATASITSAQLELLWQQKFPTTPVPPTWMLAQYQEDLLRDANIRREQELLAERQRQERERSDRVERERKEREEKERRERDERERIERERREREIREREMRDRERKEYELREDRRQHIERERILQESAVASGRILKESAPPVAAVDEHFSKSLLKPGGAHKVTASTWHPSVSLPTPKTTSSNSSDTSTAYSTMSAMYHSQDGQSRVKDERKSELTLKDLKQESGGIREYSDRAQDLLHKQSEDRRRLEYEHTQKLKQVQLAHEKALQDQLSNVSDPQKRESILKAYMMDTSKGAFAAGYHNYPGPSLGGQPSRPGSAFQSPGGGGSTQGVKNEPGYFSLYGYQPGASYPGYIKQELRPHMYDRDHDEKSRESKASPTLSSSSTGSADKKHGLTSPPPLIKDGRHHQSSVIVENKSKDVKGPIDYSRIQQQMGSLSPKSQAKLFQQHHDRSVISQLMEKPPVSIPSVSRTSGGPTAHTATSSHAFRPMDTKSSHSSSGHTPLRVSSPQQLAVMRQTIEAHRNKVVKQENKSQYIAQPPVSVPSSSSFLSTIAPPPVSIPASSSSYSYNLIQQGLAPNPMYSQSTPIQTTKVTATPKEHKSPPDPRYSQPSNMSNTNNITNMDPKQRARHGLPEQVIPKKKIKTEAGVASVRPMGQNIPSSTTGGSTTATATATTGKSSNSPSGFMDSFRSFVENTVQTAFFQDQDALKRAGKSKILGIPQQNVGNPQQNKGSPQQAPNIAVTQPTTSVSMATSRVTPTTTSPATTTTASSVSSMNTNRPPQSNTPGYMSASSSSSIMDTINRVANGMIDTDSDTLSAPSPPPHIKNNTDFSPNKSGSYKNFKKAWLQRHSDEDKITPTGELDHTTPPGDQSGEGEASRDDKDCGKPKTTKQCFVNCSYISPTKDGGSKSPISTLVKPPSYQPLQTEDSTSSASESESQGMDGNLKRRMKHKQRKTKDKDVKKPKSTDSKETLTTKKRPQQNRKQKLDCRDCNKPKPCDCPNEVKKEFTDSVEEKVKNRKSDEEKGRLIVNDVKSKEKSNQAANSDAESTTSTSSKKRGTRKSKKDLIKEVQDREREKIDPANYYSSQNSIASYNKPLVRESIAKLKKTQEPFLQDGPCTEVTPRLMKCRECKLTPQAKSKKVANTSIFCRFYAFRRLRYSNKGYLTIAGFSEPTDAEIDDIDLWMPRINMTSTTLDVETSLYIIMNVGDRFCKLVEQEKEALSTETECKIAWKRAVQGVREMCDVCDTTLFNMHWVCHKCGFVACLDCYRNKARSIAEIEQDSDEEGDSDGEQEGRHWINCSANRQSHKPDKLMLTQIIPSNALWEVGEMIHNVRDKWNIKANCPCGKNKDDSLPLKNGVSQQLLNAVNHCSQKEGKLVNGNSDDHKKLSSSFSETFSNDVKSSPNGPLNNSFAGYSSKSNLGEYNPNAPSPLSLLADVASMDSIEKGRAEKLGWGEAKKVLYKKKEEYQTQNANLAQVNAMLDAEGLTEEERNTSTLRDLLTKQAFKVKTNGDNTTHSGNHPKTKSFSNTFNDIIKTVVEQNLPKDNALVYQPPKLLHYIPKNGHHALAGRSHPIQAYTLTETTVLYPDVPHSWLCEGRLLRLHDPKHPGNFKLFQQQWRKGQPVLCSAVHQQMNRELWNPTAFSEQFGHIENDVVNCKTGVVIMGHDMKEFWDGFESMQQRLTDDDEDPMLLKLKDWPPTEDFAEMLPQRFKDLMQALPLPEYTHRTGRLNLASCLPDFFVRPDLGPKMYNAYGMAQNAADGTTNLHLDVSDAVNVMVYVGIPQDDIVDHVEIVNKVIEEAGVDSFTRRRIREAKEKPGALWQIYDAQDADQIRDLLNKVAKERGEEIEPDHDPIHDQSWYLDKFLRDRLYREYGVQGYTIVQCLGDAVFIPAGSPHQVHNLHSCIKVAEDFVSPENLNHCFQLTQEFRYLSDTHSNHEDKLQVKNIIYHAVKDSVAVLMNTEPPLEY